MQVLILGANGFIGSELVRAILDRTDWSVVGMDLHDFRLGSLLGHPRFRFSQGDVVARRAWVDARIEDSDVVLPLVAVATPASFVTEPLRVFELTFEENLRIVRRCRAQRRRLIFLSSSEVYGMCAEGPFKEDESLHVFGPVHKQRWIYASCKELLERLIWAEGRQGGLDFTLVRPFNWIGPGMDRLTGGRSESSRVVAQFLANLVAGTPIRLVDGGRQRRCFTYIDDGIEGLLRILENPGGRASGQIFNLGNPHNECSIVELARSLQQLYSEHPYGRQAEVPPIVEVDPAQYYGDGYQDLAVRVPDVAKSRSLLDWEPRIELKNALSRTLEGYLGSLSPGVIEEQSA